MHQRNRILVATLAGSLWLSGCSGGTPTTTPTTTVTTAVNTTTETTTPAVTDTGTPVAGATETGTPTPGASGTPDLAATGTPGGEGTPDAAYVKLKEEGVNLALGKGYAEAVPALEKALAVNPDDPEVHFYLMLSQGNLEEDPSPKSPAYGHAKKVLELSPGSTMAERARDYVLSAESEPAKPLPDLNADSLSASREWVYKKNALYTLPVKSSMLPAVQDELGDETKKQLWYLEVAPTSVAEKVELDKGTTFSIRHTYDFFYSKLSWKGSTVARALETGEVDDKAFHLSAFFIEVESGPRKGEKGWLVNQMDRFIGVDEATEKPVWGVKVLRLPLSRK